MKNIAFIMNSLYACGGEERVVSLIANELVSNYSVTIYTYESRTRIGEPRNDYYLNPQIKVIELESIRDDYLNRAIKVCYVYTGMTEGPLSQRLLKRAYYPDEYLDGWAERINKSGYDVVIAVSGVFTILLGYIKDRLSCRCIGWEHSSFEGYFDSRTGYYRNRVKLYQEKAAKLDNIVVLNQDIANKYSDKLGIESQVISNPKSFTSYVKADVNNKIFVTCGRCEREKGYDDLIDCFNHIVNKLPDWKLIIIGGGSLENTLRAKIMELNLSNRVIVTGYTDQVIDYLLKGSIFVMTSRWEGFPMSITEALEVGLPVIAYGIPAMEPLVTDGLEGIIVEPFDSDGLSAKMLELASDTELRVSMHDNAINKAAKLDASEIIKLWNDLLQD